MPSLSVETDLRIYVASLSDYNAGILHGAWVDVTDADTMREQIAAMLKESPSASEECPAEEWAIHDFDGFGSLRLDESEDLDKLCEIAKAYEEHGEPLLAWLGYCRSNEVEDFAEKYQGEWASLAEYVEEYHDDCGATKEIPEAFKNYIDWESMAHDWDLNDVLTLDSPEGVWVFSS